MAYQRILQLAYVDELLVALKTLFVKRFQPFLTAFVASLHAGPAKAKEAVVLFDFSKAFEGWDKLFDELLRQLEDKVCTPCPAAAHAPT